MAITTTTTTTVQHDWAALVGRILLAAIFVSSGFQKIGGFEGTAGYIASKGLSVPQVLAALTILVELGGGILLVIGWKARWAALAIAVFTLLAAFLFHNYWTMTGDQAMQDRIGFWKNLSIAGGMLMVFAFGRGRYSVDKRCGRHAYGSRRARAAVDNQARLSPARDNHAATLLANHFGCLNEE